MLDFIFISELLHSQPCRVCSDCALTAMAGSLRIRVENAYDGAPRTFYPVVVIGAGASGIAAGCRLKQKCGCDQFRVFDRQSGIGDECSQDMHSFKTRIHSQENRYMVEESVSWRGKLLFPCCIDNAVC